MKERVPPERIEWIQDMILDVLSWVGPGKEGGMEFVRGKIARWVPRMTWRQREKFLLWLANRDEDLLKFARSVELVDDPPPQSTGEAIYPDPSH